MDEEFKIMTPHHEIDLIEETTDFSQINDADEEAYQRWHINTNQ